MLPLQQGLPVLPLSPVSSFVRRRGAISQRVPAPRLWGGLEACSPLYGARRGEMGTARCLSSSWLSVLLRRGKMKR